MNVFDSNTQSCSYYIEPNTTSTFLGHTFNYTGRTYSTQENETAIYFFPDESLDIDQGLIALNETIPSTLEFQDDVYGFKQDFIENGVSQIDSLKLKKYFEFSEAFNAQNEFQIPTLMRKMLFSELHTSYNYSIKISNIQLSDPGQVYFTLQAIKKIEKHPIITGSYINTTLIALQKPTGNQIINCQNYLNAEVDFCARVVQTNVKETMEIQIWGLQKNTIYQIFWVIANELPRTIVLGKGTVQTDECKTYVDWAKLPLEVKLWLLIFAALSLYLLF
eukprot:TRINITY_DN1222_c0_g1_i3.p2 TRINITY_DN1222_c0_g1~~TRINITY_DN1222_c0_g1_i3.p2  ORF type:complete len:277 (+),score=20.90 TRINITY_DN1222_c0_g1_i3:1293-2123(+)